MMNRILLPFMLIAALFTTASAQEITFDAKVDRSSAATGEPIKLTLSLNNAPMNSAIAPPDFGGLIVVQGPFDQNSFSMMNGRTSSSVTRSYYLQATQPGDYTIGPATARSQDPRRIGRDLGGRFVLQGSVGFRDPLVRLSARLTDASQGDVVWAATETIDAGTLTGPTGDDGDSVLEQAETWGYTCTHVVTASGPDPLPNTATAEGHSGATTVTDDDSHEVDIVHPAIQIQKQARPQSGSPGEQITYHYTITNIGDVALFDISVDDDVIGHICKIASLAPGETKECTKTFTIPEDSSPHIRNVAVVEGQDEWGVQVRDDDTEVIDVILGQTITPTKTPPGGTAFTGSSAVIPLSVVALILLTAGTALLWVGRRRGRNATTW